MRKLLFLVSLLISTNSTASTIPDHIDPDWYERVLKTAARQGVVHIGQDANDGLSAIDIVVDNGNVEAVIKHSGGAQTDYQKCMREAFTSCLAHKLGMSVVAPSCQVSQMPVAGKGTVSGLLEKFIRVYDSNKVCPADLAQALSRYMNQRGSINLYTLWKSYKDETESVEPIIRSISRKSAEDFYVLVMITGIDDALYRNALLQMNSQGSLDLVLTDTERSYDRFPSTCVSLSLPHGDYPFSERMRELLKNLSPETQPLKDLQEDPVVDKHREPFFERIRHLRAMVLQYPDLTMRQIHERAFIFTGIIYTRGYRRVFFSSGHWLLESLKRGHDHFLKNEEVSLLDPPYKGVAPIHIKHDDDRYKTTFSSLSALGYLLDCYGEVVTRAVYKELTYENPAFIMEFFRDPRAAYDKIRAILDAKLKALADSIKF